jgi:hypothetical protein
MKISGLLPNRIRNKITTLLHFYNAWRKRSLILRKDTVAGRKFTRYLNFTFTYAPRMFSFRSFRPKFSSDCLSPPCTGQREVGIIVQGPLILKEDLTYETLCLYKKLFPDVTVILSTWIGSDRKSLEKIKTLGIETVLSKKPEKAGWGNINLQMISTNAGLLRAKELELRYVLKTRTDFRIYSSTAISFLVSLLKKFPTAEGTSRVVISDIATCRHRIYGATDIFQFGEISEMLTYWNGGLWHDEIKNEFDGKMIVNSTPIISEIFLCARYLKRKGKRLDFTLENWWKYLAENYVVVDLYSLDAVWFKYDWFLEQRFVRSYFESFPRAVTFSDWFSLYAGAITGWPVYISKTNKSFQEIWNQEEDGKLNQLVC